MERKPDDVTPRPRPYTQPGEEHAAEPPRSGQPGERAEGTPVRGKPGRHRDPAEDWHLRPAKGARITSAGDPSRRDEIDKIVPGPGHTEEMDELVRERMEEESPDGRPPSLEGRRESRYLLFGLWAVIWLVVLTIAFFIGGWRLAALALVIAGIYVGFAAWPAWRAGLERRADEKRAEREIEMEQNPEAPIDRQPPSQDT